jgi:hypothetical protein
MANREASCNVEALSYISNTRIYTSRKNTLRGTPGLGIRKLAEENVQ